MSAWVAEINRCKCHPETCCCADWRVVDGERVVITGGEQECKAIAQLGSRVKELEAAERESFQKYVDANEARIAAEQRVREVEALLSTWRMRAQRKIDMGLRLEGSIDMGRADELERALTGSGSAG